MIYNPKNLVCIFLLLCIPFLVTAKTTTWIGVGFTNWSSTGSWDSGVPTNGDIVHFGTVGQGFSIMDIPNLTLGELDMSGGTGLL